MIAIKQNNQTKPNQKKKLFVFLPFIPNFSFFASEVFSLTN